MVGWVVRQKVGQRLMRGVAIHQDTLVANTAVHSTPEWVLGLR